MAVNVGELIASLKLDSEMFSRGVKSALNDTDAFQKHLADLDKALTEIERSQREAAAGSKTLDDGFKGVTVSTVAFGAAIGTLVVQGLERLISGIKESVGELLTLGREVRIQEAAFNAVTGAIGQNGEAIRDSFKEATSGLVDFSKATSDVNRLLLQGFNSEQINNLGQVAKDLAVVMGTNVTDAFNRVGESVLRGNTRFLQQAGVVVDAQKAFKDYADATGHAVDELTEAGKSQAIYNAVMERTRDLHVALDGAMDPTITKAGQFAVKWQDVREKVGEAADKIRTALIEKLLEHWPEINTLIDKTVDLLGDMARLVETIGPILGDLFTVLGNIGTSIHEKLKTDIEDLERLIKVYEILTGRGPALPVPGSAKIPTPDSAYFKDSTAPTEPAGRVPGPPVRARVTAPALFGPGADAAKVKAQEFESQLKDLDMRLDIFQSKLALTDVGLTEVASGFNLGASTGETYAAAVTRVRETLAAEADDFKLNLKYMGDSADATGKTVDAFKDLDTTLALTARGLVDTGEGFTLGAQGGETYTEALARVRDGLEAEAEDQKTFLKNIGDTTKETESATAAFDSFQPTLALTATAMDDVGEASMESGRGFSLFADGADQIKVSSETMIQGLRDQAHAERDHARFVQQTYEGTTAGFKDELAKRRQAIAELYAAGTIDAQAAAQANAEITRQETEVVIAELHRRYDQERIQRDANLREQLINFEIQGNAWGTFVTAIGIQLNRIPTFMEQVANFGTQIFQAFAQESSRALSEGLFDVITGKVHDLEDVWTQFWQSMLRMILDFLASAAVSQLLQFLGSLAGFGSGTGAGAGGMSDMILGGIGLGMGGGGGGGVGGGASAVGGMAAPVLAKFGASYVLGGSALSIGGPPATAAAMGTGAAGGSAAANATLFGGQFTGSATPVIVTSVAPAAAADLAGEGAALGIGTGGLGAGGGGASGGVGGGATAGSMAGAGWMAAPAVVFAVGSILSAQAKAQQESHLTGFNLNQLREALAPERTNVLGGFAAGQSLDYLRQHQGEVGRQLDMSPGEVAQLMAQAATAVHMEWNKNVGSAMAGGQVPFGPMWQEVGPMGQRQLTDVSATNANRAGDILNQVPGFTNLGGEAQQNLIHLGATFADDAESMRELVKSVAEMTSGLVLTNEQADQLIQKGKDTGAEFAQNTQFVGDLNARLLDTTNGIGNSKIEAQEMAVALASGQVPAEQLAGTVQALATEHGPAFVEQLKQAVLNLGLSQEATQMLIEMLTSIAEMEIVIPVSYDVQGEPPGLGGGGSGGGGGGGGIISAGVTQVSDHQLGGWVGSRRDTVEPGEFVVRAEVARRHGAALEALNAGGAGQAGGGVGASAEELQRWDREIAALHEIRDELRKRPGRLAGARV